MNILAYYRKHDTNMSKQGLKLYEAKIVLWQNGRSWITMRIL